MGLKGDDPNKFRMNVPGPGAYKPATTSTKNAAPTYKIGTESKLAKPNATSAIVPGPGNYTPQKRPTSAAPSYGFGTSTRNQGHSSKLNTPGPGSYKLPSRIQDVPSYALPNRSTDFKYV